MNIIKLKTFTAVSEEDVDIYYSGRYCLAIQYQKILPILTKAELESLKGTYANPTYDEYVQIEQTDLATTALPSGFMSRDYDASLVEASASSSIDNLYMFQELNDTTVPSYLKFRTVVAAALESQFVDTITSTLAARSVLSKWLTDNGYDEDEFDRMVQYYAGSMSDDVVLGLAVFSGEGTSSATSYSGTYSTCGCSSSVKASGYSSSSCDPETTYRNYIYKYMVKVFGDLSFWKMVKENADIIDNMVAMIDSIISNALVLDTTVALDSFTDSCTCSSALSSASVQATLTGQLKNFRNAINNINTSSASIADAGYAALWATNLYEKLQWS